MKRLVRIEIELNGTSTEIKEALRDIYHVSECKQIVSMTSITMDCFRGHWTGVTPYKMAGRMLRKYPYTHIRKASVQREGEGE